MAEILPSLMAVCVEKQKVWLLITLHHTTLLDEVRKPYFAQVWKLLL